MSLIEFLLARIAEDEDVARRVLANWQRYGVYDDRASPTSAVRLRAECEAKRRIVDAWVDPFGLWTAEEAAAARAQKNRTLQFLARPYSSHPDYDPAWWEQ